MGKRDEIERATFGDVTLVHVLDDESPINKVNVGNFVQVLDLNVRFRRVDLIVVLC